MQEAPVRSTASLANGFYIVPVLPHCKHMCTQILLTHRKEHPPRDLVPKYNPFVCHRFAGNESLEQTFGPNGLPGKSSCLLWPRRRCEGSLKQQAVQELNIACACPELDA